MSGLLTNGLPAPSVATNTLPFSLTETIPVDTHIANGQAPQSTGTTLQQLTTMGHGNVIPLTDGATIATDCSLGSYFSVTLGGNRTFSAFANPCAGQVIDMEITQDGTGSRTATWNANVTWPAGTAPTLSTGAGKTDKLSFIYNATATKWRGSSSLDVR